MDTKNVTIIGMILTLVLIIVAIITPWYTISMNMSIMGTTTEMDSNLYLTRMESTTTAGGETQTQSLPYSEVTGIISSDKLDVFTNTLYIVIITLIISVISIVAIFLQSTKPKMKTIAGILTVLTFIFAILSIIYFYTAGFIDTSSMGAENVGFWYSTTVMGMNMTLGPGIGWYLMIIAGIIAIFPTILMFKKTKT